jgi:hypothetical protein
MIAIGCKIIENSPCSGQGECYTDAAMAGNIRQDFAAFHLE